MSHPLFPLWSQAVYRFETTNGHGGGVGSLTIGCGPDCPQVYHRKFPSHCTAVVHGLSQPKSMFQNLSLVITTSFRISSILLTASLQNKLCKKNVHPLQSHAQEKKWSRNIFFIWRMTVGWQCVKLVNADIPVFIQLAINHYNSCILCFPYIIAVDNPWTAQAYGVLIIEAVIWPCDYWLCISRNTFLMSKINGGMVSIAFLS